MTQQQADLVERLRVLLAGEPSTREVSMFGGRSFMVKDKMVASAQKDGGLLVRVAPGRDAELSKEPGAARAQMGTGRMMGPGWISVSAESIISDERLSFWFGVALEHNQATASRRQ